MTVAAISYDSPAILQNFAERKNIHFPLLSDEKSEVIKAFGILNQEVPAGTPFHGVPHPVTFLVNPDGTVRSRHFEDSYRTRYTTANILTEDLGVRTGEASSSIQAKHLSLTASASDSVVRGGERIRLILDISLPPKVHVYAPGVQGYIPIEWSVEESPGYKLMPLEMPASKSLHLPAINETVPVYLGKFSLQREVVIAQPKEVQNLLDSTGSLTLKGSLRYQACDDTKCYIPESIPLTWKLRFEGHDSTRVPEELRRK